MKKMLIVGLGGSGGKTVAFLMDELKVRLGEQWGKDTLPECWQFVHVDVPSVPDTVGSNLAASVSAQGGHYVGLTEATTSYGKLDAVFANSLSTGNNLGYFGRWRPEPADASKIPISAGAGAARAVGRVVTLSAAQQIYSGLHTAASKLNTQAANRDLDWVQTSFMKAASDPKAQTLVMLVTSVSGGSGSSMVMDVSDLLRGMQDVGLDGEHTAAFLYTPDVFGDLISQPGAGALATVSELLGALNRRDDAWTKEEWRIVSGGSGGIPTSTGRGPLMIFPVGAKSNGVPFGNSPEDVYRGFARMMAPLFSDKTVQNDYLAYVSTNAIKRATKNPDVTTLQTKVVPTMFVAPRTTFSHFSAWGSSTLTLGHDRYKEYAAQRIAREAVEILARSQITNQDGQPLQAVLSQLTKDAMPGFQKSVALGMTNGTLQYPTILQTAMQGAGLTASFAAYAGTFMNRFNQVVGTLIPALNLVSRTTAKNQAEAIESAIVSRLETWVIELQQSVEVAALRVAADKGLMVAEHLLTQFKSEVSAFVGTMAAVPTPNAESLSNGFGGAVRNIRAANNAMVQAAGTIGTSFQQAIIKAQSTHASDFAHGIIADALSELAQDFIPALIQQFDKVRAELDFRLADDGGSVGMSAAFRNADVAAWPSKLNPIPSHFTPALNEVMVNKVEDFKQRFDQHIVEAIGSSGTVAISEAARQIISRQALDPATGELANVAGWPLVYQDNGSHPHIGRVVNWMPSKLATYLAGKNASKPKYEIALHAKDLLKASRSWVNISGTPFRQFTDAGFATWLSEHSERVDRNTEFVQKVREAMDFASPLVDIDQKLVEAIHGPQSFGYSYWFSNLPMSKNHKVVGEIKKFWAANMASKSANDSAIEGACDIGSDPKEIHVSSTTAAPYNAAVFTSLTGPVRNDWTGAIASNVKQDFWEWRRARPLSEFLPVSKDWTMAFLQGWLVGRITGQIQTELLSDGSGRIKVRVHANTAGQSAWVDFPTELLGVSELGVKMLAWGEDESGWNVPAALLESLPLAIAMCRGDLASPLSPLDPYVAVLRLGLSLKVAPSYKGQPVGASQGVANALDLWFANAGDAANVPSQISATKGKSPEDKRVATIQWLSAVKDYLDSEVLVPIIEGPQGNFWRINRLYEIAPALKTAIDAVIRELQRTDLGSVDTEATSSETVETGSRVITAAPQPEA
jgi:hypothetical protein